MENECSDMIFDLTYPSKLTRVGNYHHGHYNLYVVRGKFYLRDTNDFFFVSKEFGSTVLPFTLAAELCDIPSEEQTFIRLKYSVS